MSNKDVTNDSQVKRLASDEVNQEKKAGSSPLKLNAAIGVENTGTTRESKAYDTREFAESAERTGDTREILESREMTDEEFLRRLKEEDGGALLPKLPVLPGWHLCWASRSIDSQGGSWRFYLERGYSFVESSEVPGFYHEQINEGYLVGKVAFKELVLMKISEKRYQASMQHFHHDKPLSQERGVMDDIRDKLVYKDESVITDMDDGMKKLGKARQVKRFE